MRENLPVLLLRKIVLLPYQEVRLELNSDMSKRLIDLAIESYSNKILVICPTNGLEKNPTENDLPKLGVITKIKSRIELPNGNYRINLSGLNRVQIYDYQNDSEEDNILISTVKRIYIDNSNESEEAALLRTLKAQVKRFISVNPEADNSVINAIETINDLDMLTDIVANFLPLDRKKKQDYMNEFDYVVRAENLVKEINLEIEVLNLEDKIEEEIRDSFDKEQREYIVKQKINKLYEELGVSADKQTEVSDYSEKIQNLDIPEKTYKKLLNEVRKYSYTSEANPDSSVIRNYLDTILDLPWNIYSNDEEDLHKIKKELDKSHYGLEEIKERILEFIAIKKKTTSLNAPILCLVGPPGTGKTTLGISISKALNREFYKISVGGLNDPAELIGHKRTYLGSSPGKIIQGLKKCGTSNPVFLIDEVDKIVSDYKGDPAAVLLEILDPSQNDTFVDNYVEEPFDLSKILFILTANDITSIPAALKDRLEIIQISSYTESEKMDIAKKYLIPAISHEYNIQKLTFKDDALDLIINNYTKESGVRELERVIQKIFRNIIINNSRTKTITVEKTKDILGPYKYFEPINSHISPGTVSTLGVNHTSGVVVNVESIMIPGNGNIYVSGNVDESIKESVEIAFTYIKAHTKKLEVSDMLINNNDFYVNALKYNVKKEGSSGGVAFVTSLISLLLNKEIDSKYGFTGEISLHGNIYKVGGIKEKLIGASNAGYKKVYIPIDNSIDLETIPEEIKEKITIKCVSNYQEIYDDLFK